MNSLKNHWLYGEQMEGFLPCPFSGELPFVEFKEGTSFGGARVWGRLISEPFNIEISIHLSENLSWNGGQTVEQAKAKLLERLKKYWNTRAKVDEVKPNDLA